jgi:DNA-binding MarR family transcriptional regulator
MGENHAEVTEFLVTMAAFAAQLHSEYEQAATRAGITPQQAVVLTLLSAPMTMRSLAKRKHCDPSNITGIVDRLEEKGLVERSGDPSDRRVKRVGLTRSGRDAIARFHNELLRVSSLATLQPEARQRLLAALPDTPTQQDPVHLG